MPAFHHWDGLDVLNDDITQVTIIMSYADQYSRYELCADEVSWIPTRTKTCFHYHWATTEYNIRLKLAFAGLSSCCGLVQSTGVVTRSLQPPVRHLSMIAAG